MRMKSKMSIILFIMLTGLFMGVLATEKQVESATATEGDFIITGGVKGTDYTYDEATGCLTILSDTEMTLSNSQKTTGYIYIEDKVNANLILAGLNIDKRNQTYLDENTNAGIIIADDSTGDVTLTIKGENSIICFYAPAIQKNGDIGKLIFEGDGKIEAKSAKYDFEENTFYGYAAIGGDSKKASGNIIINGGEIIAYSYSLGAAIGGGSHADGNNITINGGTIRAWLCNLEAFEYEGGACIGGGVYGDGNNITINGGTVDARVMEPTDADYGPYKYEMGGDKDCRAGAGIGGGYGGDAHNIIINGGIVNAIGDDSTHAAAGIGAGGSGNATGIQINGGYITAKGNSHYGVGIGTAGRDINELEEYPTTDITITGGTIIAQGGSQAPGIGAGYYASAQIYISGGSVNAIGGELLYDGVYLSDDIGLGASQKANMWYPFKSSICHSVANPAEVALKTVTTTYSENTNMKDFMNFYKDGEKYSYGMKDVKTDKDKNLYLYLEEGVKVEETVSSSTPEEEPSEKVPLTYLGSPTKQEWYNREVIIAADGYLIAESKNGIYAMSVKFTTSGTKTLYFKNQTTGEYLEEAITVSICIDTTAPTGTIMVDSKKYTSINNNTTVNRLILSGANISIEGSDSGSGVDSIEYAISSTCYTTESAIKNATDLDWKQGSSCTINANTEQIVYAKIKDKVGLVRYVSTPVLFYDTTSPTTNIQTSDVTETTAECNFTFSEESEYAYVLLETGSVNTWDAIQSKISEGYQGKICTGTVLKETKATFTNLKPNTTYRVYVCAREVLKDITGATQYNYSTSVAVGSFTTKQKTISQIEQQYVIKANIAITSYKYDLKEILSTAGVDIEQLGSVQYSCLAGNGSILTGTPSVFGDNLQIAVAPNLKPDLSQDITITVKSNNYNEIVMKLTINTIAKEIVTLSGVTVADTIYNGTQQKGYRGTIVWKKDGVNYVDSNGTEVTYVGINGTDYAESMDAPIDAGTYQITFKVKDANVDYVGNATYTYTIEKADLSSQMSGVTWYLDDSTKLSVIEDGKEHIVSVKGYPTDLLETEYVGNVREKTPGNYTATVHFTLNESVKKNYHVPDSMSVNWQIIERITPDMSNVRWIYKQNNVQNVYVEGSTKLVMNDAPYTVEIDGLPDGVIPKYSGNRTATKVGNYVAYVTFEVTDTERYEEPAITSMSLSWSIGKKTANVSDTEYLIKAGLPTSTYVYDLNNVLIASGLDVSKMGNVTYTCEAQNGAIVSGKPSIKNGIITIPTNSNLKSDLKQDIIVTFASDNYEDIRAVLTIKTISKTLVKLAGVEVGNKVYNGKPQGYLGTIGWYDGDEKCLDNSETDVIYTGIDGTSYNSTAAPVNAGTYRVTFSVKADHEEYAGTAEYTFTIAKADLISQMSDVSWYIDDNKKLSDSEVCEITEDGREHRLSVKGYPENLMTVQYSGIHATALSGEYTATVSFILSESSAMNYIAPEPMSVRWRILERLTPDMSNVRWIYKQGDVENDYVEASTRLFVNGESCTVEIAGLPEYVTAKYSGDITESTVGDYVADVTFEVTDKEKYKDPVPASMRLNWSIERNIGFVSDQEYMIKSGVETTSYEYDLNEMLIASGLDIAKIDGLEYSVEKAAGAVLSENPVVNDNILTMHVNPNLDVNLSQEIYITFLSENYGEMTATLSIRTISKTPVKLLGMIVEDKVYNGQAQGYSGEPVWCLANGTEVDLTLDEDTIILYEGVNGTNYQSETAPIDAGTYRVTCTVKENHEEYAGFVSYAYTIRKAELTSEMQNVVWYMDDRTQLKSSEEATVTEDGNMHYVNVKGYPEHLVEPRYSGVFKSDRAGQHTAIVTFELTEEAKMNYNMPKSISLRWIIKDRIAPNMSRVKWVYTQGTVKNNYIQNVSWLYANGKEYTVEIDGLPEGVKATYSGTYKASNAGEYHAVVNFEVTDPTKYKQPYPSTMELSWKVIKSVVHISNQEYVIKSGVSTTEYTYDLMKLFEKSEIDTSLIQDMECSYTIGDGSVLAGEPSVNNGIMTIPVNTDLDEDMSQKIELTLMTDVYEDINVTIVLRTLAKIPLTLSGITVEDKVYDGEPQGYFGVPVWSDGETPICDESDTEVTYIGINGTSYNSEKAPTNAGMYQVLFEIAGENQDYSGTETYTYTIQKAELPIDLTGIVWYLDDKQVNTSHVEALYNQNIHKVTIGNYPTEYVTPKYQNNEKSEIGKYTTVVKFILNEEFAMNYKVSKDVKLDWSIVSELTEISKITPDMSKVHWVYSQGAVKNVYTVNSTKLVANQQAFTVEIAGLPEGVTVAYSGIRSSADVGTYETIATFHVTDETLYNLPNPSTMKLVWNIIASEDKKAPNEKEDGATSELPAIGTTEVYKDSQYKVISSTTTGGSVEYKAPSKKASAEEIVIPKTILIGDKEYKVTSIAAGAFKGCKKLKKIKINAAITQIPKNAFSGCSKLQSVVIPAKVTDIGEKAFYKCTSLKKITIPKNATGIGKQVFAGCKKLGTITIKSKKLKKVGAGAIKGVNKNAVIKCPGNSYVKKYKKLFNSKSGYKKSMKIKK